MMGQDKKVQTLFDEQQIAGRVRELADEIKAGMPSDFVVVGLMVGSFVFVAELVRDLSRLLRTPPIRRRALMRAFVVVVGVRAALYVVPARSLLRRVERSRVRPRSVPDDPREIAGITSAVEAASRRVPRATCLTQALAARLLLHRAGYPSTLKIGVGRDGHRQFVAHAWVECRGAVVIGETDLDRYTTMPDVGGVL